MKITIHAIGKRMPSWVKTGFEDYQARFPRHVSLSLREINLPERSGNADVERLKQEEGQRLLAGIADGELVVALDERGKQLSSRQFAEQMQGWLDDRRDVSFLIGGPDGLSAECQQRANHCWSLSKATLPHMLVRVVLAEQLYRAWSILQGHPYHR